MKNPTDTRCSRVHTDSGGGVGTHDTSTAMVTSAHRIRLLRYVPYPECGFAYDVKIVVMFTASGLLVRFLKVFEKSGYQSVKWVRYLSKANGSYQIRVSE